MNISEIYSVKDCLRNADITFNCGYFPVAISRPKERLDISGLKFDNIPFNVSLTNRLLSLKLYYAIQVLLMAMCSIKWNRPNRYRMKWIPASDSFNRLIYLDESINDEIGEFYEMLKTVCTSGVVKVSEGSYVSLEHEIMESSYTNWIDISNGRDITVNIVIDTDDVHSVTKDGDLLNQDRYKVKNVSYDWEEIKDYFITLSLKDMELLHGSRINRHEPKDEPLFQACEKLDIEAIKKSIQDGANVLAVNENGESVIYKCVEGVEELEQVEEDTWVSVAPKQKITAMKECIDYLIQKGADINLYGFGCCCSPLCESEYICDASVMEFLLSRGANPNYNTDYEGMCISRDEWYIKSTVLSMVSAAVSVYGEEYSVIQEKLLLSHGAQLYIDGFNPHTGKMENAGVGKY